MKSVRLTLNYCMSTASEGHKGKLFLILYLICILNIKGREIIHCDKISYICDINIIMHLIK